LYAQDDGALQVWHTLPVFLKNPRSHPHTQLYSALPDQIHDESSGLSASLHLEHFASDVELQLRRYSLGLQTGSTPHCEQLTEFDAAVYFPPSQAVHSMAPASEEYVPGGQLMQLVALDEPVAMPLDPAGQSWTAVELTGQYPMGGQMILFEGVGQ
jgi:hypothetical protein